MNKITDKFLDYRVNDPSKPTRFKQARDDLSPQAFTLWISLHEFPFNKIFGRIKIAKWVGYSLSNSNLILRELKLCGYITTELSEERRTKLVLLRRAVINKLNFIVT